MLEEQLASSAMGLQARRRRGSLAVLEALRWIVVEPKQVLRTLDLPLGILY